MENDINESKTINLQQTFEDTYKLVSKAITQSSKDAYKSAQIVIARNMLEDGFKTAATACLTGLTGREVDQIRIKIKVAHDKIRAFERAKVNNEDEYKRKYDNEIKEAFDFLKKPNINPKKVLIEDENIDMIEELKKHGLSFEL